MSLPAKMLFQWNASVRYDCSSIINCKYIVMTFATHPRIIFSTDTIENKKKGNAHSHRAKE